MMKNMRQRPRVGINHPVSYTCHDGNDSYSSTNTGLLLNISTNGALIEARQPFTGKFLVLADNKANPRMVKAEIVYEETVLEPGGDMVFLYRAGVQFTDLHENSKEFVISIVQPEVSNSNKDISADNPEPAFDFDSISQILNDDTPTEDLILIEELLADEEVVDYDVLEDISTVLKEADISERDITRPVKTLTPDQLSKPVVISNSYTTPKFLPYFNTVCLSALCLLFITLAVSYSTGSLSESTILLPGTKQVLKTINGEENEPPIQKIRNNSSPESAFLISSSVKSRFVKKEDEGYLFVINGLINKTPGIKPEEIIVTAKIFSKNESLLGKISMTASDGATTSSKENVQMIPFLITFAYPHEDISRFTVDLDI